MREVLRGCMLALVILCVAIYIQPAQVDVEGETQYDFVFTVVNDQARPVTATLELHEFSRYLQDTHTLSATTVALRPGESQNVQVRGRVPSLGPETHLLRYELVAQGQRQDAFTIRIPIQGTPRLHPGMDVRVNDALRQEPLTVTAQLSNFGNVIAYYNLSLLVHQQGVSMGELHYPRLVQVLPGAQEEIGLLYTDMLEPGEYAVRLQALVNQEQTLNATAPFRVLLEDQTITTRQGDDLVLTLAGTARAQSISYTLTQRNRELVRDVLIADNDTVIVPTRDLAPGEYDVSITLTHPEGTDVTRIALVVRQRNVYGTGVFILVFIGALISLLFTRTAKIHMRITLLTLKIRKEEKRLKRLIEKAHQLT